MTKDEAVRYGKYAKHLFELSRTEGEQSVEVFIGMMDVDEMRSLLGYLVAAGGVLTTEV